MISNARSLQFFRLSWVLSIIFSVTACSDDPTFTNIAPSAYAYSKPTQLSDGLATDELSRHGIDQVAMTQIVRDILSGQYGAVDSILIYRGGNLLIEEYFNGFSQDSLHDIRSATKSITGLLTGIAVDKAFISGSDQSVYQSFPQYSSFANEHPLKAKITVKHLLTMSSGLDCFDSGDDSIGRESLMYRTRDWVKYFLDLPVVRDSGSYFSYCTGGVVALGELIHQASGSSIERFSKESLFSPLGITNYQWSFAPNGDTDTGGHISVRARDMLKLGVLVLQNGQWQGQQIVSKAWMDSLKTPTVPWYGYLWWIHTYQDKNDASIKYTIHYADGNGGNYIFVVPALDLVVVFSASNYDSPLSGAGEKILFKYIIPAVSK